MSGRSMRGASTIALVAAAVTLGACHLGPDYRHPETATPAGWREGDAAQGAQWPAPDWWQGFGSTELNALMAEAQRANADLGAAAARVKEADAQARIAGAPLLPSIEATGGPATQQITSPFSPNRQIHYSTYTAAVSASYEIDFWGKNAAALTAAKATAVASRYDEEVVTLSVVSSVATTYFQALGLQDRLQIARDNLANAEDVLAILLVEPPDEVKLAARSLAPLLAPSVAPGLPSELLARRPDVREAEAQLVSANANIKVARAQFFPSVSLTAEGGFESLAASRFLSLGTGIYSLAASVTQPIFEGGRLEGQLAFTQARYEELLWDYRKAVVAAFSNVEDALAATRRTAEQQAAEEIALAQARRAYQVAQAQYRVGSVDLLTVLNTENALFTADDLLAQIRIAHMQALVSLFNALGGGWKDEPSAAPTTASLPTRDDHQ